MAYKGACGISITNGAVIKSKKLIHLNNNNKMNHTW